MARRHPAAEGLDEQRQVLEPRAERRDLQHDPAEPVVQVLAEAALADRRAQVAMRRRDQADVHVAGAARAHRPHLALAEEPEEHRLGVGGELRHLVEEHGPAVRLAEKPGPPLEGARERAALVAEELAPEKLARQGAAVHRLEARGAAAAQPVDGRGDQLLAGAGLAEDQDRDVVRSDAPDPVEEGRHRRAPADQPLEPRQCAPRPPPSRASARSTAEEQGRCHGPQCGGTSRRIEWFRPIRDPGRNGHAVSSRIRCRADPHACRHSLGTPPAWRYPPRHSGAVVRARARRPAMLFPEGDATVARAVGQLTAGNPFLPERLEAERAALGDEFDPAGTLWHSPASPSPAPNVVRIAARATALADAARARLAGGARPRAEEIGLYEDLVLYALYERHQGALFGWFRARPAPAGRVPLFERVRRDLAHYLDVRGCASPLREQAAHVFAGFYQVRRAFHHIHANILGESGPARRLRAAVWQSIFTRDGRRYRRALYARMGDVATLVTGPSGTGKELVARAIGLAGYIPFDEKTQAFAEPAAGAFFPLNLAALSPTLIESELFGHRRGAFTGALEDRKGWFEACPPLGAVFLDEIGEVDPAIQVKLLRVLQTRTFQRLGDTADRTFCGEAHRRHEPGSPPGARRRPLPGGLLLPALRRPPGHAVPRRAAPGHAG